MQLILCTDRVVCHISIPCIEFIWLHLDQSTLSFLCFRQIEYVGQSKFELSLICDLMVELEPFGSTWIAVWFALCKVQCLLWALPSLATTCPHACQKHVLPAITIQSIDNQTSKLSKVDQQHVQAFCVWRFENQNEWNSCFSSWCLLSSPQKNTDHHILPFGDANCVISFMTFCNTTVLISFSNHEGCVSYFGRGFLKFFFLSICFVKLRLKFLPIFLDEPFTGAKKFTLLVEETTRCAFLVLDTCLHLALLEPKVETFFRAGDFKFD